MNALLEPLIAALRDELQQYGEMLALFDQQQELVVAREPQALLDNVAAINAQTAVMAVARREREKHQRTAVQACQLPAAAGFQELLPTLPNEYRLLIGALVDENNQCLRRIRQRGGQNQLLLSRSMQLMQRLLGTLLAATQTTTYQGDGRVAVAVATGRPLCDATG